MSKSLRLFIMFGLLFGALATCGCATESGTLTWNPFRSSAASSSGCSGGTCGPGCNH